MFTTVLPQRKIWSDSLVFPSFPQKSYGDYKDMGEIWSSPSGLEWERKIEYPSPLTNNVPQWFPGRTKHETNFGSFHI